MYIVSRKGAEPTGYQSLEAAVRAAVDISDPPCWIWRLEANRLGTLTRIEVPREEIQSTGLDRIGCIQNRSRADGLPVDGQLYFAAAGDELTIREYRRDIQAGKELPPSGRFVRTVKEPVIVTSPEAAGRYLQEQVYKPFVNFDQEEMYALLLNSRGRITRQVMLYRGTINEMLVRPAEVFREAIRWNAPALILAHNHPSGDPNPSADDVALTGRVSKAARLLDIELHDHLIVGQEAWVSLRRLGFGFDQV
jgi:hypothetical protein